MSTIKDLHNIFEREWDRKAKEDNLIFISNNLKDLLYEYISGKSVEKKIETFNLDSGLDQYEMKLENFKDIEPYIKEYTGLHIEFKDSSLESIHSVRDFMFYVLKNSKIETPLNLYAGYFFKLKISKKIPYFIDTFFEKLNDELIDTFSKKIEYLQSITNRGFSYSSERLSYLHSIGLKYDRFEFEKMLGSVVNEEGNVAKFVFATILYRTTEIIADHFEKEIDEELSEIIKENLISKINEDNIDFTLKDIGINNLIELSQIFEKCFRLSIKYFPKGEDDIGQIKTVNEIFYFIIQIFNKELGTFN